MNNWRLVIDGGFGTEVIRRRGITFKDPLWSTRLSMTEPQLVVDIHKDYLQAGADVIETNTYMPWVQTLMTEFNLDRSQAEASLRKTAEMACLARDEFWEQLSANEKTASTGRCRPLVAGSIGPYSTGTPQRTDFKGDYVDQVSYEDLYTMHKEKAGILLEAGVDFLAFETIPARKEAEVICDVMRNFPDAHAWITFCCQDGKHTCHGESFGDSCMTSLRNDAVVGIGLNCTKPEFVTSLLKEIPAEVRERKAIVVYPNNGLVYITAEERWIGDPGSKHIDDYVPEWLEHGATWIGGCCNVTPEHIGRVRKAMNKQTQKSRDGYV